MPHYPCTGIISTSRITIAIHGPYLSILDTKSGTLLQSNLPSGSSTDQNLNVFSSIRTAAVSPVEQKLVTVDDEKRLKVWDLNELKILSTRELPKKASRVHITKGGQTILVADKFGDVFSYPMEAPEIPEQPPKVNPQNQEGRKSLSSHENASLGTLILGHASSLVSMRLTLDEKYILTSDRDEHIRISRYPRGYDIEQYCLGHTKYVSALHIPEHAPHLLVSGGGDRYLAFWDFLSGKVEHKLEIWDLVHAMTKVSSQRRKFKRLESKAGTGWRARRRRERERKEEEEKKKREAEKRGLTLEHVSTSEQVRDEDMGPAAPREEGAGGDVGSGPPGQSTVTGGMLIGSARAKLPSLEDVIVISKIETVRRGTDHCLVFTAVGANAVFFAPYDPLRSWPSHDQLGHYTLPAPVLDFAVHETEDGLVTNRVWISIDRDFRNEDDEPTTRSKSSEETGNLVTTELKPEVRESPAWPNGIYLLEWRGGTTMVEVGTESEPLLQTLRNLPAISASDAEIRSLDLYALLTTLPKTEELEEAEKAAVQSHGLDVSMEDSAALSLEEPAGGASGEQTASGQGTPSGQRGDDGDGRSGQKRQVKKSGRKKWQEKLETRQRGNQTKVASNDSSDTPMVSPVRLPSRTASSEMKNDAEDSVLMKTEMGASPEEDVVRTEIGKRKAIETDNAECSGSHVSKRAKVDKAE